ncbi:MAG: sel1 repeat family protein [Polyangiaceae bacterium]|nr:sel1 repeat family protein [Polyangiaceae bacterium]MCE7892287.1 sel1 repeat family protein [Sorangiineae bacterium PRO1]
MRNLRGGLPVLGLLAPIGCGGGAHHEAMRPEQPTAAEATGRTSIPAVDGPASPLVVDWKAEQRADLEEAIHDGIAVVAWDDKGLRLLKRCKVTGNYGYLPVQVKTDVVRLETADDVQASLPLGGLGIVGKIGGEFSKGTTLDIALAMVGKRRTTWNDVTKDELEGNCDGASHYVRAILVGAFAMKTGTRAKAAAAVEIFGAGTSGESSSAKDVATTDGKLSACDGATGEESKPPSQCAAILRLELEPIAKQGSGKKEAATPAAKEEPEVKAEAVEGCPPGFVFSGGACKKGGADRPHACQPTDGKDCEAQCGRGDATSCDRLGSLILAGKLGPPNPEKAHAAFEKSCNAGYANGCANLGIRYLYGKDRDPAKAMTLMEKACTAGSARACDAAGYAALKGQAGPKDAARALKLFVRGCEGGSFQACTNAGFLYAGGGGAAVPRDDKKALEYGRRACFGGDAPACGNAGYKIELGQSVSPDPKLALALYERGCRLDPGQCFRSGLLYTTGAKDLKRDPDKAKALLARACQSGTGTEVIACVASEVLFSSVKEPEPAGLIHTISTMKPQCETKEGRACTFLGIAEFGMGKRKPAIDHLRDACKYKDPLGCVLAEAFEKARPPKAP